MDEYTRIKNKHKKKKSGKEEIIKSKNFTFFPHLVKFLLTIIMTLITLIVLKGAPKYKSLFHKYIYEQNFSFASINNWYQKKFGSSIPFKDFIKKDTETVFNEKLSYSDVNKYLDGASLEVTDHYLIPAKETGMVVFVGEKEKYGKVIIIEDLNGVETWYGNIEKTSVKMYDYIEKGGYLGEVKGTKLYMVFKKDGKVLDYTKYLT